MTNILLGVSGSVASKLTAKLISELSSSGTLQVVATQAARYFTKDVAFKVWLDQDDWSGAHYEDGQPIPHIDLGDWADILVVAPLSANSLTKFAVGIADNLLSCLFYAWPNVKPVVVAPAMNTRMWGNPLTAEHLNALSARYELSIVPPMSKRLACGTTGIGAMADIHSITCEVQRIVQKGSIR